MPRKAGKTSRLLLPTVLAALSLLIGVAPARAQGAPTTAAVIDTLHQVTLSDGSTLIGRIESRTADRIVIVTTAGVRVEVPTAGIRELRVARGRMVDGVYWAPDPNKTRLFFAPTGRAIGAGQGYFGSFFIALPFVAYGIGDRITLAGGAPVLFGVLQPFYIAPKVTVVQTPTASVAVGALSVWSFNDDFDDGFGIGFGIGTFGSTDNALSLGVGFGYAGTDVSGQPAFMIGGETRVGRKIKLISENYFVSGARGGLLSGGIRILGDRLTVDVGLLGLVSGDDGGCCAPIVNFSYGFGR